MQIESLGHIVLKVTDLVGCYSSISRCNVIHSLSTGSFAATLLSASMTRQKGVILLTALPASISSRAASATILRKIAVDTGQVASHWFFFASFSRNSGIVWNLPLGIFV